MKCSFIGSKFVCWKKLYKQEETFSFSVLINLIVLHLPNLIVEHIAEQYISVLSFMMRLRTRHRIASASNPSKALSTDIGLLQSMLCQVVHHWESLQGSSPALTGQIHSTPCRTGICELGKLFQVGSKS
mmetsp:Transcript_22855/g.55046  ORF Transcript_22855/g.55046 Transcript_22855/m.55046 type:complete len:129 (-) Transcript_22855:1536-1922(-)